VDDNSMDKTKIISATGEVSRMVRNCSKLSDGKQFRAFGFLDRRICYSVRRTPCQKGLGSSLVGTIMLFDKTFYFQNALRYPRLVADNVNPGL